MIAMFWLALAALLVAAAAWVNGAVIGENTTLRTQSAMDRGERIDAQAKLSKCQVKLGARK